MHVKMIWKHFLYSFLVLLNGPVKNALFCLMDRYRNVCVWFMARNCRFPKVTRLELTCCQRTWDWWFPTWEPKVTMARNCRFPDLETYGSQPGNQRLPLQGIAGSQKLEFMFSKLSNYHCKELRIPKVWNSWFQTWKSIRYQWKDLLIPKR